jgi:hypothetical protein
MLRSYLHIRFFCNIQGDPVECVNFQIDVLMNEVECKKHQKLLTMSYNILFKIHLFLFLKITYSSSWHAIPTTA